MIELENECFCSFTSCYSYAVFTIKERNTIRRDEHELGKYLQGVERLRRPTATIKRKAAAAGI